jgi:hypothetical protein
MNEAPTASSETFNTTTSDGVLRAALSGLDQDAGDTLTYAPGATSNDAISYTVTD